MKSFESGVEWAGIMRACIECAPEEFENIVVSGVDKRLWIPEAGIAVVERENAFVNLGLQIALDRLFGLSGPPAAPTGIGLSADAAAVVVGTTLLDPAGDATGFARKAFDATFPSRASQTVTTQATFSQADVAWAIKKVGLLNTTTDAGTGLFDVIGGAGVSPYNQPFTIDLTGVTSWSLVMQVLVTASAT